MKGEGIWVAFGVLILAIVGGGYYLLSKVDTSLTQPDNRTGVERFTDSSWGWLSSQLYGR